MLPERIIKKLDVGDCWMWTAAFGDDGYGRTSAGRARKNLRVHRYVYELLVGEIPDGLEIDHLCMNKACCNPDHLEPVTHAENMRRTYGPSQQRYVGRERVCKAGHIGQYVKYGDGWFCQPCDTIRHRSVL